MKIKLLDKGVSEDDNTKEYENPTGVEWLESMISSMILNGGDSDLLSVLTHCKKAKEMEKEQIIDAHFNGCEVGEMFNNENRAFTTDAEQYYQKTLKSE